MTLDHRRVVVWLAALVTMALTARLGFWQLGRAEEKHRAQAQRMTQAAQAPWRDGDWPCDPALAPASLPAHKPAVLKGHWVSGHDVYLDNRPMAGRTGFIVVTPLRLSASSSACPGRVVLVARGWAPRHAEDRLRLPAVVTDPVPEVEVAGEVLTVLPRTFQLGTEADAVAPSSPGPLLRQNADAAFWRHWLGQAPLAGALQQRRLETPAPVSDTLLRQWAEPGFGEDRHRAYAAQWFALSGLVVALTLWFQVIRPRHASVHVPS